VRFLKEGGAAAVKLEGGVRMQAVIERITEADIPVMGHVGLTPQSIHALGGYRVQRDAKQLLRDARAVQSAGAFAVVLEAVPARIAAEITAALRIPTIGIGAGRRCDGQILVLHDLLGLSSRAPRFARRYAELGRLASQAVQAYVGDVRAGRFPGKDESF
jgi:3-methyl-2-oxobutanoate hydroxymethyltransferase